MASMNLLVAVAVMNQLVGAHLRTTGLYMSPHRPYLDIGTVSDGRHREMGDCASRQLADRWEDPQLAFYMYRLSRFSNESEAVRIAQCHALELCV